MISCAFAGLTERLTQLHDYTQQKSAMRFPFSEIPSEPSVSGTDSAAAPAQLVRKTTVCAGF